MSRKPLDLIRMKCGKLKPLRMLDRDATEQTRASRGRLWECLCNPEWGGCGRVAVARAGDLASGKIQSCGCNRTSRPDRQKKERNDEVYRRYQAGESAGLLVREFGVSRQCILQIVRDEARRRGEKKRGREREPSRRLYRAKTDIPQGMVDRLLEGGMTVKEAARVCGIGTEYLLNRLRGDFGVSLAEIRRGRVDARNAEIYRKFMAGAKMDELANEYNISEGAIGQRILAHRRRTGAPAKCPHLKPFPNGK